MTGRAQIVAVMTAIETLGYVLSDDMFDFEAAPSSTMNKIYRIEVNTDGITENTGKRVEVSKTTEIWLAYRITAKGDRKTAFLDILDSQDALEDKLLRALTNLPSIISAGIMSKYVNNYVILHVSFPYIFWRDLP